MEAPRTVSTVAQVPLVSDHLLKPICSLSFNQKRPKSPLTRYPKSILTKFTAISPSVSAKPISPPEVETETFEHDEQFDWFSHWYALMPVCDLDKRAPHGMKVLGLDVVVWWDRNQNEWKVFDDRCPHRLAPLSEGRIDQWGRLQCVYHGWCFSGAGNCKLIPQAPLDGPPVHSLPKACVAGYPSTVQNGIVWFWPNTDPEYKDILTKKKPPYIPELDDPSFSFQMFNRDIPYGYEVLIENLMDPSHVDREGGTPIDVNIQKLDKNGFTTIEQPNRKWNFVAPCLLQGTLTIKESLDNTQGKLAQKPPRKDIFIFFCAPVSPGNCRLVSVFPRNFRLWKDPFVSRWMHHIMQNLVIDSDFYLLRVQEEKLTEAGPLNWQKVCFVPTKADTNVVAFRKWLKKYAGGQINWGPKFNGSISPTPLREQLMDRYWSHVVNCSSCNGAYRGFNALKISLQVLSVALVAIMAASKPVMLSTTVRNTLAVVAVLCFVGSKWLSHFIYKNFHFHDYNHAFK
ncbi:hypothetical protein M8C21_006016 [Ambrosia artemisiifolia]|uniref:Rieske domain-containing protein n=1 Tax=Ambrosia artemisiifolia TaxID=4212 RepID=A0AAD5CL74_AMBAR|nr:hypothetical protein M8C21_006016 [Ambrosia artemisiifolia]